MKNSMKIILLGLLAPFWASAMNIPTGTEMFILKVSVSNQITLYVRTLNLQEDNRYGLIHYDRQRPVGKLFGINPVDKLSYPVASLSEAFYLVSTQELELEEDDRWIAGKEGKKLVKRMNENLYGKLSNYLPISNQNIVDVAKDLYNSCPTIPSRKNGRACHTAHAKKLPSFLKREIKKVAMKYNLDPALVASIIQHESSFNPYIENRHEKNKCIKNEKLCSPYRWGKGLAQLGATDAHFFGLNWFKEIPRPKQCVGKSLLNKQCFIALRRVCKKYDHQTLRPVNCPVAAIEAVAKKLHSLIPKKLPAWVKNHDGVPGSAKLINLSSVLQRTETEKIRNLVGLYNRGVKVYNSYVEYYDHNGHFPQFFGEAWAMPRTERSPSISMGYQMLTKEYIGRCYVWELAGICGPMPKRALVAQFRKQFD
jgi:hypothetical protein